MINNRLLLSFICIIISLFGFFLFTQIPVSITGNTLLSEINVSINPFDSGRISLFNYPYEITQYSSMMINTEFLNIGSTTYTKSVLLEIGQYDANMTMLANRTGFTTSIQPGERSTDILRYTPLHWLHLTVSYSDKTIDMWGTFYVKPYYSITVPSIGTGDDSGDGTGDDVGTGGTGGSGGTGGTGGIEIIDWGSIGYPSYDSSESDSGRILVTLHHPDKVYVMSGESSVVYVLVNNTGTMTLRRMMLLPRITGNIKIDAQSKNVQVLKGGQSAIFLIALDVPDDIDNRTYPLDFELFFDKGNRTGHVDVIVGNLPVDESLLNTILNYRYILTRLNGEMDALFLDGINITIVKKHISDAESALIIAKDYYDDNDYKSTRIYLEKTKGYIIDAVIELARLRNDKTLIVLAPTFWIFILLIIMMIIAISVIYIHKRKLKEESKKQKSV